MRKSLIMVVVLSFLAYTTPVPAQQRAPEHKPRPHIAVMDLQIDEALPANLSEALSNKVRETLMGVGKYVLIERSNIEVIMTELARGQMGCYDESCTVEAGRLLSAHFIVTGRVIKLGPNECQISVRMTDVARAKIVKAASDSCECTGDGLNASAENVAFDLVGIPRQTGKLVIQSSPSGAIIYIDGEREGNTPFNIEVRPGKHKVTVTAKGYKLEEQTINVPPGVSMSLNFSLKKARKKWYQTWWLYTAIGVVVAGGVTAAILIQPEDGDGEPTPTGSLTIQGPQP